VHRVERIQALEVFEGFHKECAQESFQDSGLQGISGRIGLSNLLKDSVEKLCLEELSRCHKLML
jgi:hypothetical protein